MHNDGASWPKAPQASQGLRVLVIDDEKNIRETLALCLEQAGCEVQQASSSAAALLAVRRSAFNLAFLDLRLGPERGEDLIPRLIAATSGLPIVVMTAYATTETAAETLRRGAWDYLRKPFTPDQVREVLRRLKERGRLAGHAAPAVG